MGNACEAFVYGAPQVDLATWLTPTVALRADSVDLAGSVDEVSEERQLGSCRGSSGHTLGARPSSGTLAVDFFDRGIGKLLKTLLKTTATTGSTGAYVHGMLYNDAADLDAFSGQIIYSPTLGTSILGAVVNTWELSVVRKEKAKLTFGFEARDDAESSDDSAGDSLFWHYDPAVNTPNLVNPATMYPTAARGLWFYDAEIYRGGTFTFNPSTKRCSVAGGTKLTTCFSVKLSANHNLDTDGYFLDKSRTRSEMCPQNRELSLALEFDWCDQAVTIKRLVDAGAAFGIKLTLLKTANLGVELYLPAVFFTPFPLPAATGDKKKRTLAVTGKADVTPVNNTTTGTTDMDLNLVLLNAEATI